MIKDDSSIIKPFFKKVAVANAGERLDVWLAKAMNISRKKIKKMIDDEFVRINSKNIVIAGWKLAPGDEIRVVQNQAPRPNVIFEDDHLIIINKPALLLSVPVDKSNKPSAFGAVIDYLQRKYKSKSVFLKPLHRLDAGTSGLLMFAKSRQGLNIMESFRNHKITRMYTGIIKGRIEKEKGVIRISLQKGRFEGKKMTKTGGGVHAETSYEVIERYPNASLLRINVTTGRTHQIRAHLAGIEHPLIGDNVYGKAEGFKRPALHAERLVFSHPVSHQKIDLNQKLPNDMIKLIEKLREGRK